MTIQKNIKTLLLALAFSSIFVACNQTSGSDQSDNNSWKEQTSKLAKNKVLVKQFIEAMRTSNVEKLKTMITPDFSWWIIGKPEYLATGGEHDSDYFLGFFKGTELFPEGADFTTTSMISEGNIVAAEAEFKAKTAMGTNYENYYHFLFIIENGKIKRMKEYMDTYHAKVTFGL